MPRCFAGLKSRSDFKRTYQNGRSWANRLLVLYISKQTEHHRLGFSVGKRVGNAVTRNRVKRRLKEASHKLLSGTSLPGDCIIIARSGAGIVTYSELTGALYDLFKRAKVLY